MKKTLTTLLFILVNPVFAQELATEQQQGKQIFDKWCTPCHGAVAGGRFGRSLPPGTAALETKYKGDLPALLEERTDLQPVFIRTIIRNGLFAMPSTRKTEVSDQELDAIISYLTRER